MLPKQKEQIIFFKKNQKTTQAMFGLKLEANFNAQNEERNCYFENKNTLELSQLKSKHALSW